MLKSLNFVVLGDASIAADLGKKGTATDITIYDRKSSDMVATWTVPTMYPDKIQPLMQAINMADFAIINATKLDKFFGEQILALDSVALTKGIILHSYDIDRDKLKALLKKTVASNYSFADSIEELKEEISKLEPPMVQGNTAIPIDHAFDVKGVGTVILGAVKGGYIKVHDNVSLMPAGKTVQVKSIQMHDDPVESASSPARVGLAIKGATAEEISRGDVLCEQGTFNASLGPFTIEFEKNEFFKGQLIENQTYMVSVGLQIRSVKIKQHQQNSKLEFTTERPIAYQSGQTCVLLKPDSATSRIVGKGLLQ
jgi:selenocysteine-specific translation elongation factor